MASASETPHIAGNVEHVEPATVVPSAENGDAGDMSFLESVRKFPKVIAYVFLLCPAILLFGFDTVIVSTLAAMPYFQLKYGEKYQFFFIIPSSWLGVWNASGPLGAICGSSLAGWIHDRFGRRFSLFFNSLLTAVGVTICYTSASASQLNARRGLFLLGKFVEGFSSGSVICTTQTYLSEILPHSLRGSAFALFPFMTLLGQLIGSLSLKSLLFKPTGYLIAIASQWPYSFFVCLAAILIPESPTWLVRKGRIDAARKSQKRLYRAEIDANAEVDKLCAIIEQEKESAHIQEVKFSQAFKGVDRRRTCIVVIASLMPNLFGLSLLGSSSYFLETVGLEPLTAFLLLCIGIGVGLAANAIAVWTMSVANRRPLLMIPNVIIALLWLAIGISGSFIASATNTVIWFSATTMVVIVFVAGSGVWPASVLVSSETSSLRLRGRTQAISWIAQNLASGVFSIILPYIFQPTNGNLGLKTGYIYFGTSVISIVLVWFFIPEMRGRSNAEINAMFINEVPTRKFPAWSSNSILDSKHETRVETVEYTV